MVNIAGMAAAEKIRLRIGNLAKAVLVTGQTYQDPKDALNEFVSNAADEYAEAGIRDQRIRIYLSRKGRRPFVAVEDVGRGMNEDRLRQVAKSLFESRKAGDPRTLGEKAIGILAFQQVGARCEIVSRPAGSETTLALKLERGKATAELLTNERRRAREAPGTTVYIHDLDPDVIRVLTRRKVVDYMRRRRGAAIARSDYQIEVIEGRQSELVTPEEPEGIRIDIPPRDTMWGRMEFSIYVAPRPDAKRRVAVAGRAGTTIIDDLSEVEEFEGPPWSTDQVSGLISFEGLQQTTGRRALLRDREAFPIFLDAVKSIEPVVLKTLERVTKEVDAETADHLNDAVRKIFSKVLKELSDLDNPMRSLVGSEGGTGGLLERPPLEETTEEAVQRVAQEPEFGDLTVPPPFDPVTVEPSEMVRPGDQRSRSLPSLMPDPNPDGVRSRFDEESKIVYYNDEHPDFLMLKDDQAALLDYLSTLVAKEYVVYNNPRAQTNELAEELVRIMVRVRRYLPRKL